MFEYQTLQFDDSIRLLVLDPAPTLSARLTGSLLHTTWPECDQDLIDCYSALSYVWGKQDKTSEIWLDGFKHGITANLEAALRDIRDTSRSLRVWADAICINQNNAEERHKQVALMGRIYTAARNTIIYLGPLTPQLRSLLISASSINRKNNEESLTKLRGYADDDLLRREWFTRVWIFQELLLSKDPWIQCGQVRARWTDLCTIILPSNHESIIPPSNRRSMLSPVSPPMPTESKELRTPQLERFRDMERIRLGYKTNRPTLEECLRTRRGCGVTQYQDVVYGNLGIADDAADFTNTFPITYEKFWVDVFTEAATHILHRHGLFSLGAHHMSVDAGQTEAHAEDTLKRPSWVPDWRLKCVYQKSIQQSFQRAGYDYPSRNSPVRLFCDRSTSTLWVVNEAEDTVKTVSDIIPRSSRLDASDRKRIPKLYSDFRERPVSQFCDPSRVIEFLCQWLGVMKKTHPGWEMNTGAVFSPSAQLVDVPSEWKNPKLTITVNKPLLHFMKEYMDPEETAPLLEGRRLATTQSGSVGFVPAEARPGDKIMYDSRDSKVLIGLVRRVEEKKCAVNNSDVQRWVRDSSQNRFVWDEKNEYRGTVDHVVLIGECFFIDRGKKQKPQLPKVFKGIVIH